MTQGINITEGETERAGLTRSYGASPAAFDEMFDPSGALRPHWFMFVNLLDDLGPVEIRRRWQQARQLIHDNGVTYNVYGDPQGMDRPWNLDPVPFLVDHAEWKKVEAGLTQRAKLLDLVLADIYGPQRLLADGIIPAEIIYGHPNFLRPVHNIRPPGDRWLHLYGADLGRSPDGSFCVIGDRTQTPSGAGYALENRIALSRALPDVFRDCGVQRLAGFFRTLRETAAAMALHNKENPRVVLLTPGPYNETYFEHAYLARYLGYTLVEGGDLTVRDDRVYLKTLAGLQQVDVILRRLDDDFCDPLELRGDSFLGVPGLVQSVYAGNVAVVNALGTGLAESPALMPLLPRLARHLLGEDLKLCSVGTFWCGDPLSREHVLANLPRMVIKPTFPASGVAAVFGEKLTRAEAEKLTEKIRHSPGDFVAQEQLMLSTTPALVDGLFEPRHVGMRAHLVATGESYAVMPGGLARFSASVDTLVVSMQQGGGSKDTWVLAEGPVDPFTLLPAIGQPIPLTRSGNDLPSRVADNLFWLGRYVERGEGLARLMRGILMRSTNQYGLESSPELPALLTVAADQALGSPEPAPGEAKKVDEPAVWSEQQIQAILFDESQGGSLLSTLGGAHRLGSILRDRLSIDTWRIINSFDRGLFYSTVQQPTIQFNDVLLGLDRLILMFAAFGGLAMESMTRGHAWRFMDMGRRLERALSTLRLLRGTAVPVSKRQGPLLEAVLEIADSSMTYRRRYLTNLQPAAVLDLLLMDESNPRSVAFQLHSLSDHIAALPRTGTSPRRSPEEQIILRCLTGLRLTDIESAAEDDGHARRLKLDDLIGVVLDHVYALSDAISQGYLSHANVSHQLGSLPPVTNL